MTTRTRLIPIASIKVGGRFRSELGDLETIEVEEGWPSVAIPQQEVA